MKMQSLGKSNFDVLNGEKIYNHIIMTVFYYAQHLFYSQDISEFIVSRIC